jgi:hypothetical protein
MVMYVKMAVFWVVTLCCLVKFTGVSEVVAASIFTYCPDDEDNKHLRNVGKIL